MPESLLALVELALLHQVDADVIVWIPEVRIELDGLLALFGRFIQAAQVRERFARKRLGPQVGLEPTTLRLTAESQREALRRCARKGLKSGRK